MSKKKLRMRITISFVTIALVLLSILTEGTAINSTIAALAMFMLVVAAGLNIYDGNTGIAIVELILVVIYTLIIVFLVLNT